MLTSIEFKPHTSTIKSPLLEFDGGRSSKSLTIIEFQLIKNKASFTTVKQNTVINTENPLLHPIGVFPPHRSRISHPQKP